MPQTVKHQEIHRRLLEVYPEVPSFLHYQSPFQLLVAVILSAQCTDAMVNKITPRLFSRFPGPRELSEADPGELEDLVHATGFFRMKASNIRQTAKLIQENFQGEVPSDFQELVKLPGVGRKTAHVICGTLFGRPAVIVDTHFKRVVARLGLTRESEPEKVERDLTVLIPPEHQYRFSMAANILGREFCHARKPNCSGCPVADLCPSMVLK